MGYNEPNQRKPRIHGPLNGTKPKPKHGPTRLQFHKSMRSST